LLINCTLPNYLYACFFIGILYTLLCVKSRVTALFLRHVTAC